MCFSLAHLYVRPVLMCVMLRPAAAIAKTCPIALLYSHLPSVSDVWYSTIHHCVHKRHAFSVRAAVQVTIAEPMATLTAATMISWAHPVCVCIMCVVVCFSKVTVVEHIIAGDLPPPPPRPGLLGCLTLQVNGVQNV
jgi:hypothetical protein